MLRSIVFYIMWLLFGSGFAAAQTFTVSPTEVEVGQSQAFTLIYTLNDEKLRDFQAPSFDDFHIAGGPNKSTSVQIINGSMTSSVSLTYVLQPKQTGMFVIPPATVVTQGGKTLRSQKVMVEVMAGQVPQNLSPSPQGFPNLPFPNAPQSSPPIFSPPTAATTPKVFIRALVDTPTVYQGQQLTLTYRLYSNTNVTNVQISDPPALTGFWTEELQPSKAQGIEDFKGSKYATVRDC